MAVVAIGDKIIGAFEDFVWAMPVGVKPYIANIETERESAKRIFEETGGEPTTLQVGPNKFEQVYVTALKHGSEQGTRRLELRDRRWLWDRNDTVRRFNIRTQAGTSRLLGEGRIEQRVVEPEVKYHSWSLDSGKEWRFIDAIVDLFLGELGISLVLDQRITAVSLDRVIDFEDFDEKGTVADLAQRLLSYARGFNLRIDKAGQVILYDTRDTTEFLELSREHAPIRGGGWAGITDKRYLRPRKIRVLFTREIEVRFDYQTFPEFDPEPGREPRQLLNVIPVPVKEMTLSNGDQVAQETILTFEEYYNTDELTTNLSPSAPGAINDSTVARFWNTGSRPGAHLETLYAIFAGQVDQAWSIYISAIIRHWRRTFQVVKPWVDRVRSFRAERVAIYSYTSAARSRARSPVFTDYTINPSIRWATQVTKAASNPQHQVIVRGYKPLLKDATPAPAPEVQIRPGANGLLRIYLTFEPGYSNAKGIIPGVPTQSAVNFVGGGTSAGRVFNAILAFNQQDLEPNWNLATILTCIQGAPNNNGQLHEVEVEPAQAEGVLGYSLEECLGPELTVIIDETPTTTARFAWLDQHAKAIEECFYSGSISPPDECFVNQDDIEELALAAATRVYEFYTDRAEGSFTTELGSPGEISGTIGGHVFQVNDQGVGTKKIEIPPISTPIDPLQFVDASVRRKLQRLVELP